MTFTTICLKGQPMLFNRKPVAKIHDGMFRALISILALTFLAFLANSASFADDKDSPSPHLTVLYTFLGEADGANPNEATLDPAGNLYGTTTYGGNEVLGVCAGLGCGVVFKIDTRGHESLLYSFTGQDDGAVPYAGVLRDSSGVLYGNATSAGGSGIAGVVFKLRPSPTVCAAAICPWKETVLHAFSYQGDDGYLPAADLIRDEGGNLYGTTVTGGTGGCGIVYKIDSQGDETVLYSFQGQPTDGCNPFSALLLGADGDLYGTTSIGGASNAGTVFKLSPNGSVWTETLLYSFTGGADGASPSAGLISDGRGDLYGTTYSGGAGSGVVFELTPNGPQWAETVIHTFGGPPDGANPWAPLLRDSAGNLYGTTVAGGTTAGCPYGGVGCGTIFMLSPNGLGWTETILWSFTGGADGAVPYGPVVMDAHGILYSVAWSGGDLGCHGGTLPAGCGTVFKLTP